MLGVIYPLIYEYLFNQKISVGAPFYSAIFSPIVLIACVFLVFSIDSKWSRKYKLKFNEFTNSTFNHDICLDHLCVYIFI